MIVLGQRGSRVVDMVKKYPVFAALCLASAIGVLLFGLAGVAKLIPLDPLVLANCSGQLIPDSILSFSSATTGGMPSLNV